MESNFDDVINTSHNVSYFKRTCVDLGYYEDDYIQYFSSPSEESSVLLLWMYLRVTTLRKIFEKFMESFKDQKVQFVNLGAGLDTISFWVLKKYNNVVCYDLDFYKHLKQKTQLLHKSNKFTYLNYNVVDDLVISDRYKMVPVNFENLDEVYKLEDKGLSRTLPTFFLSEFCLTYVENDNSDKVIKFLSEFSNKPSAYAFLDYVGSWTEFGKWYSKVFYDFGAEFKSFKKYDTIEKHTKRHKDLGWDFVSVNSMTYTYNELLGDEEKERVTGLQNFQKFDELATFANHTVIGTTSTHPEYLTPLVKLYDKSHNNVLEKNDKNFMSYTKGLGSDGFNLEYFKKMLKSFIL